MKKITIGRYKHLFLFVFSIGLFYLITDLFILNKIDENLVQLVSHDESIAEDDELDVHYKRNLIKVQECYEESLGDNFFSDKQLNESTPIVLWWTPFTMDMGSFKTCRSSHKTCFFTNSRKYRSHLNPKAFVFYGTDFKLNDLPLPRKDNEDWGLLHEESPKNNYLFSFESIMRLFNHTATFKRESDLTLVTQFLTSIDDLESTEYFVSTKEKNRLQIEEHLAPVAYVQSDCITPSDRDIYVQALMKHIGVDSYGKCLHNKDLPEHLREAVRTMSSEDLYRILAKYKFVLAMENAVCDDYVTEKLWRSFYVGSVPLAYGSSKIGEILPEKQTVIDILDFKNAEALANYLNKLNKNDTEYEKYLKYKKPGGVKNQVLLDLMSKRKWGINNDRQKGSFIDHFECLICERMHENLERKKNGRPKAIYQASLAHYGCPMPYTFTESGEALNENKTHLKDFRESTFKFSYEFAYFQQKIFFEEYLPNNIFNFSSKELKNRAIDYHRNYVMEKLNRQI